jgi:hypothetical protein
MFLKEKRTGKIKGCGCADGGSNVMFYQKKKLVRPPWQLNKYDYPVSLMLMKDAMLQQLMFQGPLYRTIWTIRYTYELKVPWQNCL